MTHICQTCRGQKKGSWCSAREQLRIPPHSPTEPCLPELEITVTSGQSLLSEPTNSIMEQIMALLTLRAVFVRRNIFY